jgi:hypothetical protein
MTPVALRARSLRSVAEAVGDERKLSVKWPDYVFQDNYARLTLAECCQHVDKVLSLLSCLLVPKYKY